MRFDLLGGNYFHALSRADLSQKGGQQLLCKSFFFFCSLSFYFSHKRRKKQNMNATKRLWILFFNKFRKKKKSTSFFFCFLEKGFFPPYYTVNATATHMAQTANLYPKLHAWTPVHIHCHTRHPDGTGEFYRQILHVSHSIQRKPSTLFLLINNNSERFKLQSM